MCALVPTVADQFGLSGVWLTIALMGAVQGPLFPTSSVYLSRWMPGKDAPGGDEKAWGTSMLDIGISLGSLLIIPVGNGLAEAYGWRNTYRILGGATMAFVGLWQILAAETPLPEPEVVSEWHAQGQVLEMATCAYALKRGFGCFNRCKHLDVQSFGIVLGQVLVQLLDQAGIVGPVFVQPEDRLCASRARARDTQAHPVANGCVFGLTHAPNITFRDIML